MSRIFVSNLLQDESTLIIGGITILPKQKGVTVSTTEPITKIEVRAKNPGTLMKILAIADGLKFENDVTYEARRSNDNPAEVLLVPVSPDIIRFKEKK